MTLRNAERIMELTVERIAPPSRTAKFCFRVRTREAFGGEEAKYLVAYGSTEKVALNRLVNENYRRMSLIVINFQRWLCGDCGERKPLQCHHVQKRSHGRKDTFENLRALCLECHARQHGGH